MAIKKKQNGKDRRSKPDEASKLNDLPVTFKFAAETLKTMSERGGSAGSIVVDKYKNYNYKLVYALVMNTVKNLKIIKKIIHEAKLMKKVNVNDNPFLLEILVGDLLFGKRLKTVEQNSTAASVIALRDTIIKQQELLKKDFSAANEAPSAKYIRINHLKSNLEHVIGQLKSLGFKQLEYSKDKIKFKKFVNKFKSMETNEFMVDFHFPNDLIVIKAENTDKLRKSQLLTKGKVMLQDKASFMAVQALGVKPNDKIIDACCAPGGKTSLIGQMMKNKGKILAYDMDKKRLVSAIHLLKVHGVNCAKLEVQDFSKVKLKRLLKTHNVDIFDSILIDPSCSGSGIQSRVDYKTSSVEAGRLKKLRAFQISLLKHALTAKVSKSIVYCTCSCSVEENEQVVEMALKESKLESTWKIEEVLPYWQQRGDESFEFGSKCVRSDINNLTNGFFIAKLVQVDSASEPAKEDQMENGDQDSNIDENEVDVEAEEEDDDDEQSEEMSD